MHQQVTVVDDAQVFVRVDDGEDAIDLEIGETGAANHGTTRLNVSEARTLIALLNLAIDEVKENEE